MAEGSYEYECMRAELLGIEKPDLEEFERKSQKLKETEASAVEEEERDIQNVAQAEKDTNNLKGISGGLEELTSILSNTQKRLNRFKNSYSSLTNLLKFKKTNTGSNKSMESTSSKSNEIRPEESVDIKQNEDAQDLNYIKSDLSKALDRHVDKLDSLIDKAEDCQYSMQHQRKQINKFVKK